jgi:HlyD family secretion protein
MKKAIIALVLLAAIGGGGFWLYQYANWRPEPTVNTATVSRGDILDSVGATGQLEPLDKVQVGTQVSGVIQELHADYNSIVKKGQLLAQLDPRTFETQVLQAEANLIRAQTDVERNRVTLEDANKKLARAKDLSAKGIINQVEFETADINAQAAQSALKSSEAALNQQQAALEQQKLNLENTRIYSPIDGIVVSRVVDVGQTVQASMQAPVLFNLAADLTEMRVLAGVDEADVGRIRPQQSVTFRIDAYPSELFRGTVEQVRLEAKMQQNVVTYSAVISVPNGDLKLKPGMTANINIEISRKSDVVRVPNSALRFRPTNDMYTALGLPPPPDSARGGRTGGRGRNGADAGQTAARGSTPPDSQAALDGRGKTSGAAERPRTGNGEGDTSGEAAARRRTMTPEERERMMARAKREGRGGGDASSSGWDAAGRGRGAGNRAERSDAAGGRSAGRGGTRGNVLTVVEMASSKNATTIDHLFPPLAPVESRGRVWTWDREMKVLSPHPIKLGITDGQVTELLEGDLPEGMQVVTNIITQQEIRPTANNPFVQPGRGPGNRGGFPGGGGGAGRGRGF